MSGVSAFHVGFLTVVTKSLDEVHLNMCTASSMSSESKTTGPMIHDIELPGKETQVFNKTPPLGEWFAPPSLPASCQDSILYFVIVLLRDIFDHFNRMAP